MNIVNDEVASQIAAKVWQCSTKLFTFNSEKQLTECGKFTAQLRYKHRNVKCDFVVVEGNYCSIISYDLGVLKIVYSVQENDVICNQYSRLFQGIGKMKDTEVKLHIDNSNYGSCKSKSPMHSIRSKEGLGRLSANLITPRYY